VSVTLPVALLGNGSLLATFSEHGRVEQLWWPHPDHARPAPAFDLEATTFEQSYVDGAQILRSVAGELVIEDVVHDTEPVLLRRVSHNGTAVVHSFPRELDEPFDRVLERRRELDTARLASAKPALRQSDPRLYERSLLVFDALADRVTGAVIAAPECDPQYEHSGGYGFVWPRDLAFGVLAFLAAGRRDLAVPALRWLVRAQQPSGLWLQRYHTDAGPAPSWCTHQLDETASALFVYEAAWRELRDRALDTELWPSARRAADFLLEAIADEGVPIDTYDLWEEREGSHAYTAASFVGALRAAACFAERHEPGLRSVYADAAERAGTVLERCFWSDEHGRYLRTLGDPTIDASLLGLAWPFAAVDPRGERMRATAAAVDRALGRPGGGLLRYESDTYAGGNPWILAALWLGLYRRQIGDSDGHARALAYAERVATPLGLLAEQVTDDGTPAWVLPLAWSHAMFVLASRPELDLVRDSAESLVRVAR
jgi:GH15 family glucan-1,4-alpha-glucosidase